MLHERWILDISHLIDAEVENIIKNRPPDISADKLIGKMYGDFTEMLKVGAGAGTYVGGMAEYFLFRYILKALEYKLGKAFKQSDDEIKKFEMDDIVLTHDYNLVKIDDKLSDHKFDIAILMKKNEQYHVIAAIEIKAHYNSIKYVRQDIEHLQKINNNKHKALLFWMTLNTISSDVRDEIERFHKNDEKNAFFISSYDSVSDSNKDLDDAMNIIVARLKKV
jgi:hypothetical protein